MAKARQQYFADEVTLQKENRDFAIQPELVEKLESIEAGAQVNVIETVKVNGEALIPDENKAVDVSVPLVEDTLYSTDTDKALSANQGKVLYEYIQNLASRGRYLSNWNAVTGLPTTNPVDNPYQYRPGDYYVVSNVAAEGGTNYRPDGSSYSRNVASTTVETEIVKVGDYYTYDGQHWLLLVNTAREIAVDSSLSTSSTNPVENRVVTNALNTKQNNITDLETIRSGAALGATALQPGDSLSELSGTSDDITQGTTNLFMTTAERSKLSNQSGVNTGDETQTTIKNKLGQASTSTDGYLTSTDWNTFNNKQGTISDLETIRSNASAGKNASDTIATYGDIVTHDASEFATAAQGALADSALQSGDNVSELANDAGYITDAYHDDTKQDVLTAGNNITIRETCEWDTQGPAPDGFHIPSKDEWEVLLPILFTTFSLPSREGTLRDYLKMTLAGYRSMLGNATGQSYGYYWTSTASDTYTAFCLTGYSGMVNISDIARSNATSIRCFKNAPVVPDNSWTTLYDGSSVATGAGIFHNTTDGLISISGDGVTWYTIQDKNLGATEVFNGGTVTDANSGYFYQWGNNYGFAHSGDVTTSSTQVDASNYGPGNYYNSSTFITRRYEDESYDWSSTLNNNLWGGVTQGQGCRVAISATDTTYVAGDFDIKDLADSTGLRTEWSGKQDELIAGANIQIAADGKTISSTDTTYTAGPGISISNNNVISNTQTSAEWGNITGTLSDQTDLKNALDAKQDELTAGDNVSISEVCIDTSDMQGPAPDGFHVPLINEWRSLYSTLTSALRLGATTAYKTYLKMPLAGRREFGSGDVFAQGSYGLYWSSSPKDSTYPNNACHIQISSSSVLDSNSRRSYGYPIRPFKNTPVVPDSSWTIIYQGTGDAGIFYSSEYGLFSISGDGTNWITITDKNLGATTVYSDGATLSEANCGYYYQWGNNYGFPGIGGTISTTSPTQVDASTYGPNTSNGYYESSTFITGSDDWSSVHNDNLWGGVTQQSTQSCSTVISSTDTTYTAGTGIDITNGVISNTQTSAEWGNITGTLSNQTDLQSVLDAKQDDMVILSYGNSTWNDFITAYQKNGVVYCRASSQSNPATGTQGRLAFMAYVNNADNPTEVEFQYYRSRSNHDSAANQIDEVYVYKLVPTSGGTWSVTQRNTAAKPTAGTGISLTYGSGNMTIANTGVTSVNSQTGDVTLTIPTVPTNVSDFVNDAGYITANDLPDVDTSMSDSSTNAVQNNVIKNYVDTQVQEATSGAVSDTAYGDSWNGITGIAPSKNTVYDKISAMDTTIAGKQDTISDLSTIRTGAGKGATAVQPGDNVSTLTNDAGFITKAVSDLTNYYTKSETYTKAEVADYVANFAGFKVVATLPTTDIKTTIIYLLGPLGTGADKYEEYIYSNNAWVKIGETSVDLTNYFNTSTDNSDSITQGSTNLFLTSAERTKLSNTSGTNTGDETKATIQSKLGAATSSNDGYLSSADWTTFNNKANASDINTKTFYLSSTSDLTNAQAAYDWFKAGKLPIIRYNNHTYVFASGSNTYINFHRYTAEEKYNRYTSSYNEILQISVSNGTVTSISNTATTNVLNVLRTDKNYTNPYTPTYDGSPATKKYVDDNAVQKSATAPSSPTEGMVWYDTTNDQLKVYDGSNWNVTGKEYNAGEGIEIGTEHSDMQGPAPDGFHVPLNTDRQAVYNVWTALGGGSSDGTNFGIALKLPFAGFRKNSSADVNKQGALGLYWSSSRSNANNAYNLNFSSTALTPQNNNNRAYGYSVRCFKNSPTVPTSNWTKLYGTSIESGGIFWSSTDGLISLSSDGSTWITIADKNLGATTVWNSGDTLSETNCGKYYQWGNNYGFPRTGTIANQSTTQVDASNYGPGNYYSSDTFIKYVGRRDTTDNGNLWGGVSQGTWIGGNTITNTGVLSVNGQTGNVTLSGGDMSYSDFGWQAKTGATITLDLASTITPSANFTVTAPSTIKDGQTYILRVYNGATPYTMTLGTGVTNPYGTSTTLTASGIDQFVFLAVGGNLELQPEAVGGGSAGAITNDTTGTTSSISKIWVGTEAEYQALSTYEEDVAYMTF